MRREMFGSGRGVHGSGLNPKLSETRLKFMSMNHDSTSELARTWFAGFGSLQKPSNQNLIKLEVEPKPTPL